MYVLVDVSIGIDHLHRSNLKLVGLLQTSRVVMHTAILGELSCGTLPNRQKRQPLPVLGQCLRLGRNTAMSEIIKLRGNPLFYG